MAGEALLVVVFLLLAIAGPFVLYAFVRDETRNNPTMSRADAERMVRRDTPDDGGRDGHSVGTAGRDARSDGTASDSRNEPW